MDVKPQYPTKTINMKNLKYLLFILAFAFVGSTDYVEAQVRRTKVTTVRQKRRVKRKVRRHNRRITRRTLRALPRNTRPIVFRRVSYYPVGGIYYIQRRGVYVRAFPPRGFRLRVLPAAAIAITVRGAAYRYADGIYYQEAEGGEYEVAEPPVGAVLEELPEDAMEIDFDGVPAYELNDAVYKAVEDGYELIDVLEEEENY